MTEHLDALDDPSDDDLAALAALLARADTWEDPPRRIEEAVVAAIVRETGDLPPEARGAPFERRTRPVWSRVRVLAAAAAVVVVVAGIVVMTRGTTDDATFALAGTEVEPGASAEVVVSATPAGLKILLDTEGLPGAPDGYMYEA